MPVYSGIYETSDRLDVAEFRHMFVEEGDEYFVELARKQKPQPSSHTRRDNEKKAPRRASKRGYMAAAQGSSR